MLVFINDKEGVATGKFLKTIIRKFKFGTPQGYSISTKLTIILTLLDVYQSKSWQMFVLNK